jgi:hypothetical protein
MLVVKIVIITVQEGGEAASEGKRAEAARGSVPEEGMGHSYKAFAITSKDMPVPVPF